MGDNDYEQLQFSQLENHGGSEIGQGGYESYDNSGIHMEPVGDVSGIRIGILSTRDNGQTVVFEVETDMGYMLSKAEITGGALNFWMSTHQGNLETGEVPMVTRFYSVHSNPGILPGGWQTEMNILDDQGKEEKRSGAWVFTKSRGNTLVLP